MIGGVGKNAITDALCKLFKNYSGHIENIDGITKNFNSHLTNKLFIYGDEINANAKKVSDKLKQVITRPTQNLEKKGIDSIEIDDYSNYKDRVLVPVLMGLLITPISRKMHKS